MTIKTILQCTCDICGSECAVEDSHLNMKIKSIATSKDVGHAVLHAVLRLHIPYAPNADKGLHACKKCIDKTIIEYAQGLSV